MKKLANPVRKVKSQVIGLDVHKQMIAYCILDRRGCEVASGELKARPESLNRFLEERVGRRLTHLSFESSGYSLWVYDLLVERYGEERVHVAQPKKIRAIANSQEKNDANDAFWLAYLTHEGRLPEAYVPPAQYRSLRIATRDRIEAVRRRTRVSQRLRAHLAQIGRLLPTATLRSAKAVAFVEQVAAEVGGERGHALQNCLRELAHQDAVIQGWDERIEVLARELPAVRTIERELPGAGVVLASTIVAEAGPIRRFRTAKAFGKYTGLVPSERSSGGRTRHGGISREGSGYLRWALTQMAMACLRSRRGPGVVIGDWIRKKQRRVAIRGKARCAAARKLAESIWRLFHYGECFDPARPFGAGARTRPS